MADFGNQGGFGELLSGAKQFNEGSSMFSTSVGAMTAGLLGFKKLIDSEAFGSLKESSFTFKEVIGDGIKIIGVSKFIDITTDLVTSLYQTRKDIERTYGVFSHHGRNSIVGSLMETSEETRKFGIGLRENLSAFKSLSTEFRSFNRTRSGELVKNTSMISRAFELSDEAAASIVANFERFGGKGIVKFFDEIGQISLDMGLDQGIVAQNLAGASKSMYRFDISSRRGKDNLRDMATYATKIGVSMMSVIESVDQFRTISGAMEASVKASRMGINLGVTQLLSSARGGDMTFVIRKTLDRIAKYVDPRTGAISQVGIDIADQMSPIIGMSRDQIADVVEMMHNGNLTTVAAYEKFETRLIKQQMFQERVENIVGSLLDAVLPVANVLMTILDWITRNTFLTRSLLIATVAGWAWAKGKGLFMSMMSPIDNMFSDILGGGDSDGGGGRKGRKGPSRRPDGTFGTGMSPVKIRAYAKAMMASAVPMIAFAGSIWILSKAFQNFNDVQWDSVQKGLIVMGGFVLAMGLMSTFAAALATGGFILAATLLAFGGAMFVLAGAFKLMDGVDISGVTDNLGSLGWGLAKLGLAAIGGLGLGVTIASITAIGIIASKYANPIETLSYAIERLANSMVVLSKINLGTIDTGTIDTLGKSAIGLVGAMTRANSEVIETHITIEIDGTKLLRKTTRSIGIRS